MTSSAKQLHRLMVLFGGKCHYCGHPVQRGLSNQKNVNRRTIATRDHIVPASMGGSGHLNNFVLSCAYCNETRATKLLACSCTECSTQIKRFLDNEESIRFLFDKIIQANKIVVSRVSNPRSPSMGLWQVKSMHHTKNFSTYTEAIDFATSGAFDSQAKNTRERNL